MLLNDSRLITGLLKEALFSQKPLNIESSDQRLTATLEIAEDDSPRVLEAKKTFSLKFIGVTDKLSSNEIVIRVDFTRFTVVFVGAKVISIIGARCVISCPTEAQILNRRSTQRTPFPEKSSTEVVVQTTGLHSKASFTAHDHSVHYIGGFLRLVSDQPIDENSFVSGRISLGNSYLDIYARIISYVLIESNEDFSLYRVVIKNFSNDLSAENDSEITERRNHDRVEVSTPLDLCDPEQNGITYEGTLRDCSLSGFTWQPSNPELRPTFPVGAVVEAKKPKLQVRFLGHRNETIFAFEIVKATVEERHLWMDILNESNGLNYKVQQGSEAEKVLSLFIESGALATGYVNSNKNNSIGLRNSLHKHSPYLSGLVHRWKLRSSDQGEIDTLASAFRVSESGWMIGDIAAKISSDLEGGKNARKEFIYSFINSFCRFCETLTPCPEVSILFLEAHPFWKEFVEYVMNDAAEEANIAKVSYFRFDSRPEEAAGYSAKKISGRDWKEIKTLSSEMVKAGISPGLLDARPETFGSPLLSSLFQKFNFDFERNYFLIDGPITGYLVINKFSSALTLNQTVNCSWFFPSREISNTEVDSVRGLAKKYSLRIGSAAPGLIIPSRKLIDTKTSKSSLLISGSPSLFAKFFIKYKEGP